MTDLQIKYIIHRYRNLLMAFDLHANGTLSSGDVMFEADVEHRKKKQSNESLSGRVNSQVQYHELLLTEKL